MIEVRKFEKTLGNGVKKIEKNEKKSEMVQRRSIRIANNLKKGIKLKKEHFVFLRPKSNKGLSPYYYKSF